MTKLRNNTHASLMLFILLIGATIGRQSDQSIDIGSRLELLVDSYLIQELRGSQLRLHSPVRAGIAFEFDKPWEGGGSTYVTVMQDGRRYRAYYRGSPLGAGAEVTCYAESDDGIHWSKPLLRLFEHQGSLENNIVWAGDRLAHNFAPFKDSNPAAPEDQRYKAVAARRELGGLFALASADGISWRKIQDKPVITDGAFDSQNIAFWDRRRKLYVAYYRDFILTGRQVANKPEKVRAIKVATSTDFVNWTPGKFLDYGSAPTEHFYTNAITPYFQAPHIYVGFPKRFLPERRAFPEWKKDYPFGPSPGVSDSVFMTSRDGSRWDRTFLESFLRPGLDKSNWNDRNMMMAWGLVQTGPEELSLYWVEHYKHASNRLARGTLAPGRFISVNGPFSGGEMLTKPLRYSGSRLQINYSTSAAGSIQVELQDRNGNPIRGNSLKECDEIFGDQIERVVTWRESSELPPGQTVRLRVSLKDADLYSIQFVQ